MKHIQILRHAKSSWKDLDISDHDRPLNKRGKRTAPLIGKRLAKKSIQPQLIVSSTAKRAFKTAKIVAKEISHPHSKIVTNRALYHASVSELLTLISETTDDIDSMMLVGHNPGLTYLANHLCRNEQYFTNIPTVGLVTIALDFNSWQEITVQEDSSTIQLIDYDYPKLVV